MKKILVPTDFSEAASNAFRYALDFARPIGADLEVLHCYAPALTSAEAMVVEPLAETERIAVEKLKQFVRLYPDSAPEIDKQVSIRQEVNMGFPAEYIVGRSKEGEYDLILMSTRGQHGFWDKVFGSVSSAVSQNAFCPVLLIPNNVSYQPYKNIVYATNRESADPVLLNNLMMFAKHFEATIHFVHIEESYQATIAVEEQVIGALFRDHIPSVPFHFTALKSENLIEGITVYCEDKGIDLIAFATRHRSFWNQLMHRSQTKLMALHTTIPMLVMHSGESDLNLD